MEILTFIIVFLLGVLAGCLTGFLLYIIDELSFRSYCSKHSSFSEQDISKKEKVPLTSQQLHDYRPNLEAQLTDLVDDFEDKHECVVCDLYIYPAICSHVSDYGLEKYKKVFAVVSKPDSGGEKNE